MRVAIDEETSNAFLEPITKDNEPTKLFFTPSREFVIKNFLLKEKEGGNMNRLHISIGILLMMAFLGCSAPLTTREKGAAIGTLGGAGLGAIIGSATGNAGAGAGIGSLLGLGAGFLFGDQLQGEQQRQSQQQQQIEQTRAELERQRRELESLRRKREF